MHISKTLIEVLNDSFTKTLERRHNKPAKDITWKEMTKHEHTIQLDIVAMKNKTKEKKNMTGEIQNFDYDINYSFETNFIEWFKTANRERFDWKEDPLHQEEAYDIFVHKYGHHRVT